MAAGGGRYSADERCLQFDRLLVESISGVDWTFKAISLFAWVYRTPHLDPFPKRCHLRSFAYISLVTLTLSATGRAHLSV